MLAPSNTVFYDYYKHQLMLLPNNIIVSYDCEDYMK